MFARLANRTAIAAAALAVAGLMVAPSTASAQSYTYQGPQNYGTGYYGDRYDYNRDGRYNDSRYRSYDDYCRSDRGQRQGAGAVIGGALGAVAGSQMAARGRRTEGSILGGVLGAVVGAGVGNSSGARCDSAYDQSRYSGGYGYQGYQTYDRYDDRASDRYYDDRSDYRRYDDRYDDRSYSYSDSRSCRTVETRTRDYNGRLVTRSEQVCDGY